MNRRLTAEQVEKLLDGDRKTWAEFEEAVFGPLADWLQYNFGLPDRHSAEVCANLVLAKWWFYGLESFDRNVPVLGALKRYATRNLSHLQGKLTGIVGQYLAQLYDLPAPEGEPHVSLDHVTEDGTRLDVADHASEESELGELEWIDREKGHKPVLQPGRSDFYSWRLRFGDHVPEPDNEDLTTAFAEAEEGDLVEIPMVYSCALTRKDWLLYALHHVDGLTLRECAKLLRCSYDAARKRNSRLIRKLNEQHSEHD